MFMTKSYDICYSDRVPIIMNWLGQERLFCANTNTENK